MKKHQKPLQKHSKALQKQAKGSQNQAKDTETPLASSANQQKGLIKESKLSHKGPEAPETLKMTQKPLKTSQNQQKHSKKHELPPKGLQNLSKTSPEGLQNLSKSKV